MVYEPREDSFLLLKHIPAYAKGDVLDMGTGSGILAEEAAHHCDSVLAVDVDPEAVEACGRIGNPKIKCVQSDLFEKVPNRKFDLIIFNAPYLPKDKGVSDRAIYGGEEGHETIARFLGEVRNFLKEGGKILLLFSSHTGKEKIDKLLKEMGLNSHQIDTQHIFYEDLFVYLIE